jgi:ABC-type branched-subunit amino acid transport system ATPase component
MLISMCARANCSEFIGPNGSGKSTLFDCCTGLQTPDAGTVHLDERDITRWPMHRIAREGRFIRSFQKTVVFETMRPRECLITAGQMFAHSSIAATFAIGSSTRQRTAKLAERADHLIDLVGLTPVRNQPAGMISSLMTDPRLVLLDEPLAGINPVLIERIVSSIRQANRELNITFVVIEHNIDVIMNLANRIVVLDQGSILDQGAPETIVKSPKVVEAYLGG